MKKLLFACLFLSSGCISTTRYNRDQDSLHSQISEMRNDIFKLSNQLEDKAEDPRVAFRHFNKETKDAYNTFLNLAEKAAQATDEKLKDRFRELFSGEKEVFEQLERALPGIRYK